MKIEEGRVLYIMGASCALMDKIRRQCNSWADGDENICMTFEEAVELDELRSLLKGRDGGMDVIVSR